MSTRSEPTVALYLRIPISLRDRLDAAARGDSNNIHRGALTAAAIRALDAGLPSPLVKTVKKPRRASPRPPLKPGDIIRVKLNCPLVDLGKWTANGFEIVAVQPTQIIVKRPGAEHIGRWAISHEELTIGKGNRTTHRARPPRSDQKGS